MKESLYYTKSFRSCRREWSRNSPARKQCFDNAKIRLEGELDKWTCTKCKSNFALSECQCDHIVPVGTNSPQTKKEYMMAFERQEVDISGLQILCKPCHKVKTKSDLIYQIKSKMVDYILDFCEKNSDWCPPITVTIYDNIKLLSKIKGLMKKIGETGQDEIRIEKHKKTLEKLVKDTV